MNTQEKIRGAYRYWRSRGCSATVALERARNDAADVAMTPRSCYGYTAPKVEYNPPYSAHGESHVRWVEHANTGLRFIGFADEIDKSIRHRGWFTDDYQSETFRGVVYQLPARNRETRYAYGYADPNNDGAACLSFDDCDSKEDAASWADSFAERAAESERDYRDAWQHGRRALEEIPDELRALQADRQRLRGEIARLPACGEHAATIERLESALVKSHESATELARERASLIEEHGDRPGFRD